MSIKFKYQSEIQKYEFLFEGYSENDRLAFRWVFTPINHPDNFVPRGKLVPEVSITSWSLSFFETIEGAKARFVNLNKGKNNLYKIFGTDVAGGNLKKLDGLSNVAEIKWGHFEHFEYENVELQSRFEIFDSLITI